MTRVALLSSEPLRAHVAGIGIRYVELARRLPRPGLEVVVLSPADPAAAPDLGLPAAAVRRAERGRLAELLGDCDAVVAQGQWANDALLEVPGLPVAIDLYDPWLIENLHYYETLGLDPYRNDHASWILQLARGDFFLCSSQEQRLFYLGFLAAVGRVNPERVKRDPELAQLIAAVPFGVPEKLPPAVPYLPPRVAGERRLLFGGLYDWYDPWTLLDALERLDVSGWRLFVIRNPHPEVTPQRRLAEVEAHCRRRGWGEDRVVVLDWVPSERRYDLLRDVDLLVAPHRPSLEADLSLRTRFLDALAAGCPVITSQGGTMARLLRESAAGWVVPPGDAAALAAALREALEPSAVARRRPRARALVECFAWERVLAPLVRFCTAPWRDATKEAFAHPLPTVAPADRAGFRLRRLWRRLGR